MEVNLVINYQFNDKNKQQQVYEALLKYSHGSIEDFTIAVAKLSDKNDILMGYPTLTEKPGPESITKLTKAGNTIAYFICSAADAEQKGNDLRGLLIDLGVTQFKGYLETDFGEKQNLKKYPESKRKKASSKTSSFVDRYEKYLFNVLIETGKLEDIDKRLPLYEKLAHDAAIHHDQFLSNLSTKAQEIWRKAFIKGKTLDDAIECMSPELEKLTDPDEGETVAIDIRNLMHNGLGIDKLKEGLRKEQK
jgi:hypothetical protein